MCPKTVSAVPANFFMLLDTYLSGRYFVAFGQNQAMLYCKAVDKIALEFVGFPSALITLHTFKFKSLTFRSDPLRALLKYCMILECIDKK